jgi:predicted ABC-type ATPase
VTEPARITVIAGVNGAGKSSVAGTALRQSGGEYFNPDEVTRAILSAAPGLSDDKANGRAWAEGRQRLEAAIRDHAEYAFETTLGGRTITNLLFEAMDSGLEVAVFFVGLASADMHLARVRSRVVAGGHDIPEAKIRQRYTSSMANLVHLAPRLTVLRVFDNSTDADPKLGQRPP